MSVAFVEGLPAATASFLGEGETNESVPRAVYALRRIITLPEFQGMRCGHGGPTLFSLISSWLIDFVSKHHPNSPLFAYTKHPSVKGFFTKAGFRRHFPAEWGEISDRMRALDSNEKAERIAIRNGFERATYYEGFYFDPLEDESKRLALAHFVRENIERACKA